MWHWKRMNLTPPTLYPPSQSPTNGWTMVNQVMVCHPVVWLEHWSALVDIRHNWTPQRDVCQSFFFHTLSLYIHIWFIPIYFRFFGSYVCNFHRHMKYTCVYTVQVLNHSSLLIRRRIVDYVLTMLFKNGLFFDHQNDIIVNCRSKKAKGLQQTQNYFVFHIRTVHNFDSW